MMHHRVRSYQWDCFDSPETARHLFDAMTPALKATLLLVCSNVFMTFAWDAHPKNLRAK